MARLNASNNAESVLVENVSALDTTIVVEDASVFPAVPFRLSINNEIVEVASVNGNELTVERAKENTVASDHAIGDKIGNRPTAGMYNELVSEDEFDAHLADNKAHGLGEEKLALGLNAKAIGMYGTAIGGFAEASSTATVALGISSKAANIGAVAVGQNAKATGSSTTALGTNSQAIGPSAVALGNNAKASGTRSIALGQGAEATMNNGIAIGYNSRSKYSRSISLGHLATAESNDSIAFGYDVNALNEFESILGSGVSNWEVPGSFSVNGTKNFEIPHPHPAKKASHIIRHGTVESPTAGDTLYRYKIEATQDNETVELQLPDYFQYLNKNIDVWVNGCMHFGKAFGIVEGDTLKVTCELVGQYNVLVIGTRNDDHQSVQDWNIKGVEREIGESWTGETYVFSVDEIMEVEEIKEESA